VRGARRSLGLREALRRVKERPLEVQQAVARAYRRSRERASVAENLWLAGAPGALEAARESLEAAIEAASLASDRDEAAALAALGLPSRAVEEVLGARGSTSLREILGAARRLRRALGPQRWTAAQVRRIRLALAAALLGLLGLLVLFVVRDIQRRMQLARAPWAVSYWDNAEFEGSPRTQVGWQSPSHDWGEEGPLSEVDGFALRLESCLRLEESGTLRLRLGSDDGSRAYVDGAMLVDNWGDHGPRQVSGERPLGAGAHRLRVDYYERGGGAQLHVDLDVDVPYELSPVGEGCD